MRQRALIDINLLLDTRYGTLQRMDETIANTLVGSNAYRERHHDNFDELTNGKIDRAAYADLYARSEMETLFFSKMTDFVYHLRKDVLDGLSKMDRGVEIDAIEIDINLYPYEVDDQSAETIRRSVAYYLPPPAKVNIVRLSPEALSPKYIDKAYEMLAYYNHEDWLGPNTDKLIEHRLPLTVLLTPTIASSGILPDLPEGINDPFSCRSASLLKFITLHYIPTGHACHNPLIEKQIMAVRKQTQSSEGT